MTTPRKFALLVCLIALGGCEKEATGQVAAVVNGEEITLQEVNAELANASVPEGADQKALRQAALERIVERRLLAQAAREDGLDKSSDFLIRKRQLEDTLLVQLLAQKATQATGVPDPKKIQTYIQKNPAMFADRTIYQLDMIQFPMPADPKQLEPLGKARTMDELITQLQQRGIKFQRGTGTLDSAKVGQEKINQIRALPAGEPFISPQGNVVTAAVITGEAKQPIATEQASPMAVQAMRNSEVVGALQQRLKDARAKADIKYQAGFAPPKTSPASGTAAPSEKK
jgi:peptidyl-prolyl cis-trans isomerase C